MITTPDPTTPDALHVYPCVADDCCAPCELVEGTDIEAPDGAAPTLHWVECTRCGYRSPQASKPINAVNKHAKLYRRLHPEPPEILASERHRQLRARMAALGVVMEPGGMDWLDAVEVVVGMLDGDGGGR